MPTESESADTPKCATCGHATPHKRFDASGGGFWDGCEECGCINNPRYVVPARVRDNSYNSYGSYGMQTDPIPAADTPKCRRCGWPYEHGNHNSQFSPRSADGFMHPFCAWPDHPAVETPMPMTTEEMTARFALGLARGNGRIDRADATMALATIDALQKRIGELEGRNVNLRNQIAEDEATYNARIRSLEEKLTAVQDGSFCTKCGWHGVPLPVNSARIGLDWQCGNPKCGYMVPPPKSAIIARLQSALTAAEKERDRAVYKLVPADALADEVAVLIKRKVIGERSPAADALLDYREPPTTERSDALATTRTALHAAEEKNGKLTAGLLALWWTCDGSGPDHTQRLCDCDIRDEVLRLCGVTIPDEHESPHDSRERAVDRLRTLAAVKMEK